ncbi:MAG: hypothetical protein IAF94_16945 [Pirellulaceae bacterium]|nr:hypothetical protein [Pirellulaceae bacterium]
MNKTVSARITRTEQAGRRLVRAIVGTALIAGVVGVVPVIGICRPLRGTLLPVGPMMRFMAWVDPAFSTAPEVREMQRASRYRVDNTPLAQPNACKDKQPQPQVGQLTAKQGTLVACKT